MNLNIDPLRLKAPQLAEMHLLVSTPTNAKKQQMQQMQLCKNDTIVKIMFGMYDSDCSTRSELLKTHCNQESVKCIGIEEDTSVIKTF